MPDCGVRGPRFESHRGQLFNITTATAIYSLGHGLHTLTAVPRSTQPSTLRGTVKCASALGLGNNKMAMVDVDGSCHFFLADSQSKSVGLFWELAATSALSLHSSNEPGELSQWLCHGDSTINIISVIIIIIIIINTISMQQWLRLSCVDSVYNWPVWTSSEKLVHVCPWVFSAQQT